MTLHLLALETSSNICDVAVLSCVDDTVRVWSVSNDETGRHAECLLPMVDQALAQAGITRAELGAIAFGQGPGGFTGLRVASGVTQGMAFGLGVPVIPVPSLLAVAVRASQSPGSVQRRGAYYLVAQDARMGEVYFAVYASAQEPGDPTWRTVQDPILIDATLIEAWFQRHAASWGLAPNCPAYITGDALDAYPFLTDIDVQHGRVQQAGAWRADAQTVAHIARAIWQRGETQAPELAIPLYVRDKVAFTTAEREQGAGGNPRAPVPVVGPKAFTIRPMTEEHLDAVATIEARVQSFPWTRRNFADGLVAGYPGWVACDGERVIGFYMVMMAPDIAHLLVVAVDPEYQGKGAGKQLLAHCQEEAANEDLDTLVLEVRVSNTDAIGFYQHYGFNAFSVRKNYYPGPNGTREDASVMKKAWPRTKDSA